MNEQLKFCVNCAFVNFQDTEWLCFKHVSKKQNLVTGKEYLTDPVPCQANRYSQEYCGKDAKWFCLKFKP